MGDFNKMSEDEEDLEALRLAALQSLKRKSQSNDINQYNNSCFNERSKNRRGKFFRSTQNRNLRNGQLNNWNRNSNLIAVPVISNEDNQNLNNVDDNNDNDNNTKRLILPQDRYCKNTKLLGDNNSENINSPLSKFDRYDNSDRSDSSESDNDDDDDVNKNNDSGDKDGILKRSNSLEALMEELENEIKGETKKIDEKLKDDKVKTKKKKQVTTTTVTATATATTTTTTTTSISEGITTTTTVASPTTKTTVAKENLKPDSNGSKSNIVQKKNFHHKNKKWQSKNLHRRNFQSKQDFLPIIQQQQPCNILPPQQFLPSIPPQFPPIYNQQQYENLYQHPTIFEQQPPHFPLELPPRVPIYDQQQQISPLHINTDSFTTTTTTTPIMAPLSPRSAAFVLENRAIIEKRKRRSYSPNSSQSSRSRSRSIDSRLSLSPRYRRSKSRSPLMKKRQYGIKSPTTVRRVLSSPPPPPTTTTIKNLKQSTIHERLGSKTDKTDNKTIDDVDKKKFDDPIMEARRKKFESNQLIMKEGVIRLKTTKMENNTEIKNNNNEERIANEQEKNNNNSDDNNVDDIDEDALLEDTTPDDDLELNPKFDVLFSDDDDDESNSDNEGRFKIKQQQQNDKKIVVMPFTKLINGTKSTNLETKFKDIDKKNNIIINNNDNGSSGSNNRNDKRKHYRSKSPNNQQSVLQLSTKKIALKTKKIDKNNKTMNSFPIDNKKIEIKIRNPAKYEENDDNNKSKDNCRKVEIMATDTTVANNNNNNENKDVAGKICEGDLRTQLSRKRAERQKQPLPDVVPSRLLQNALQSVGFDKGKKIKIDKNDNKDGKLPIRLRLGTTTTTITTTSSGNTDGFGKKLRKRGNLEQV